MELSSVSDNCGRRELPKHKRQCDSEENSTNRKIAFLEHIHLLADSYCYHLFFSFRILVCYKVHKALGVHLVLAIYLSVQLPMKKQVRLSMQLNMLLKK